MRRVTFAVAGALFAVSAFAQIKITREKSGHHYGDGEGFAQPHQAWNGTPFVLEADLEVPRPNFRNAAWFGVWVDDRPHRERYILGLVNTSGKTDPEELQWGIVMYPRKGFSRTLSKDRWGTAAKKVTVRVAFDGRRLSLQRPDGRGGFVRQAGRAVPPHRSAVRHDVRRAARGAADAVLVRGVPFTGRETGG